MYHEVWNVTWKMKENKIKTVKNHRLLRIIKTDRIIGVGQSWLNKLHILAICQTSQRMRFKYKLISFIEDRSSHRAPIIIHIRIKISTSLPYLLAGGSCRQWKLECQLANDQLASDPSGCFFLLKLHKETFHLNICSEWWETILCHCVGIYTPKRQM